jgi:diguanylate cyclase (GGDEF)-like protein/PAS domain S-box-containing protein
MLKLVSTKIGRSTFSRMPLRVLLIVPFVLQVSVAVGVTGWLSIRNGERAVNEVASQLRNEVGHRIEGKLEEYLAVPHLVNEINLNAIQQGYIDPENPDAMYRYFFYQAQQFDLLESIFFGHVNGEFVGNGRFNQGKNQLMRGGPSLDGAIQFSEVDANGELIQLNLSTSGWNTQTRPWYRAAVEAQQPVWGDIFTYHAYPLMAIPASRPVYDDNGELIGVLGNNFFLSQISDFLQTLDISPHGQTFIMERDGMLVASSTLEQPFEIFDGKAQRLYTVTSTDPLIRASSQFLLETYGGDLGSIKDSRQLEFRLNDRRQFLQVRPFGDATGLDWLIVVVVPERDFMAQIEANTRHTVGLMLLALGGAIASGLLTSRWITRPIRRFSEASKAIAQGDLQQQITETGFQELESLATSFTTMAQWLQTSFNDLQLTNQRLEQANTEIQDQADRFRLIADNMSDLVCLHHARGKFLYVSPSVEWLLGYRPEDLQGKSPWKFVHPADRQILKAASLQQLQTGQATTLTHRIRHKLGHYLWLETITRPILDAAGQVVRLQTASRNVTETVRMRKQLEHDAFHDSLTGLPNRNLLLERLELCLQRSERYASYHFAVLFLDIDRFKIVNDSLGHLVGDELLMEVASRIKAIIRPVDLVVRLGGDEFIVLLDDTLDSTESIRMTEHILETLRQPLQLSSQQVFVTVSVGLVLDNQRYQSPTEVIRDADIAMYRAKAKGRNGYEIFDTTMHTSAIMRLQLENDLRQALLNNPEQLVLYYQPIVDLKTNSVKGFEALVRWQHPERGMVSPVEFIPIAEETGLIIPLGNWLMQLACLTMKTWQSVFPHAANLSISVNLSAAQLHHSNLLEQVDLVLAHTELSPQHLILEITESMLMDDIEANIAVLQALRQRSIAVSIDDFGTGYSSLSYLYQFPISYLKIDRSFVSQMLASRNHRKIVETIITLARQLNFQTVAEGIETQDQVKTLQTLNCDFGQGYWFGKPQPAEAIEMWLRYCGQFAYADSFTDIATTHCPQPYH